MRKTFLFIITFFFAVNFCVSATEYEKLMKDLKSSNAAVKQKAIIIIGNSGMKEAVPGIIDLLGNDKSIEIRRLAAVALGNLRDDRAVPFLIQALQKSKEMGLRKDITNALFGFKDRKAVEALLNLLKDLSPMLRRQVISMLGKSGDLSAAPEVEKYLNDISSDVRLACLDYLAVAKSSSAVAAITQLLTNDRVLEVRISATSALGEIGSKMAVKALSDALKSKDLFIVCGSARALGKIGSNKGLNPVLKALITPDSSLKILAIDALLNIKGKKAFKTISGLVDDKDEDVSKAAREAIQKFGKLR